MSDNWWLQKPRKVNVVVDNPSWILMHVDKLLTKIQEGGDTASLITNYADIDESDVSFYLGCIKITPPHILVKSKKNLVVHESDLPLGRGFSPLTWQILEGKNEIPFCLIEMANEVDAGLIVFKDKCVFNGFELVDELRLAQARKTFELCLRYLQSDQIPIGEPQVGDPTFYARRRPEDSEVDPNATINEIFNLLRVVDNEKYPAFFVKDGKKYVCRISKE